MTTPPDKLFRQGLEHYQKPAPGSAWERIESGLDRKRNRSPWMKIAAGLLIVIVTSVVIVRFNKTASSITTVSKESAPFTLNPDSAIADTEMQEAGDRRQEAVREEAVREEIGERRQDVGDSRESSGVSRESLNRQMTFDGNPPHVSDNRKNSKSSRLQSPVYSPQSSPSTQKSVTPEESHMAATTEPVEINTDPTSVTPVEITNEISTPHVASNAKRTNITYTAEEVNAKYLKKESTTEATPEKKNTSGLQKVIDLALDLKNEGSVLGDIREKKNEWLSFNSPSNKRETNK